MEPVQHLPEPDQPAPYRPVGGDVDTYAEALMQQGKTDDDYGNDLRDPWFHTVEGREWLAEQAEQGGV